MQTLELVSRISLSLIAPDRLDERIDDALEMVGTYLGVSRAYIFRDNADRSATTNTHEWCGAGISPQIDSLQDVPYETLPSWKRLLDEEGLVRSGDIGDLPPDLLQILESQGIKSIVVYPLRISGANRGFIGFDECTRHRTWDGFELNLLKTVSGIISGALERAEIENRLRVTTENFRVFFNSVQDLFFVASQDGAVLHANDAVVSRLGYSLEALRSMTVPMLYPAASRETVNGFFDSVLRGACVDCPSELETAAGTRIPVETKFWKGSWDGLDCVFGISRDLGPERESLQKFSKLFQTNPAMMAISGLPDRVITEVNDAFVDKLGYAREEAVGRTVAELGLFMKPSQQARIRDLLEATGRVETQEADIRRKDGAALRGLFSGETIETQGKRYFMSVVVDVTEQRDLADKLERQNRRLENIIEGTGLGTWEWNIRTGETTFNERWAEMLGYSLADLEPIAIKTWTDLLHPDDSSSCERALSDHFKHKTPRYESEHRMRHKSGDWVWILDKGSVIEWDEDGKPLRMFGTHQDITERKRAEERLRETEKRYNLALTAAGAGLWDWDMVRDQVYYSPLWKSMLGYAEADIGDTVDAWKKLWHPADASAVERAMEEYLRGEKATYETTYRIRHKNGSWRWMLTRGGLLKNSRGEPYRWIGTNIDVTEERERSAELERFFSVNLDLLCIADLDGRFLKVNTAWSDILGYTVDELEHRRFLDFVHPDDVAATLEAVTSLSHAEAVLNFVNRYRHRDGSYRFVEWRSHPYGRLIYAAARDVTERIELENRLRDQSIKDALTGAYNRRHSIDRLSTLAAENRRNGKAFSVALADLDHFKAVNDTYGHQAGDMVLKEFCSVISANLRPYDVLGRYGGEEFLILFLDVDKYAAALAMERILEAFGSTDMAFGGANIRCRFSCGVADSSELSDDALGVEKLIETADGRLYAAKKAGRNRIVVG